MLNMTKKLIAVMTCVGLMGCAGNPDKMVASYVSPIAYQNYTCAQLDIEETKISNKADELYGHLKKEADADAAQMFVGLVLFWPALFFLEGGDGPEAAQYTQLKGKYKALKDAQKAKNCIPDTVATVVASDASDTSNSIDLIDTTPSYSKNVVTKIPAKIDYLYVVENECKTEKYYLKRYAHEKRHIPNVINKKVKTYEYNCLTSELNKQGKKIHTLKNFQTLIALNRDDTLIHFQTRK